MKMPPWAAKRTLAQAKKADRDTLARALCAFADLEIELRGGGAGLDEDTAFSLTLAGRPPLELSLARSLAARDFLRAPLLACSAPRLTARSIVEISVRRSPSARSVSPSPTAASRRWKYVLTEDV